MSEQRDSSVGTRSIGTACIFPLRKGATARKAKVVLRRSGTDKDKRGSRCVGAGAESFTDPLKRANETDLGMGRYEVTDIVGEYAERDGENDIDSSVYVWYARQE